MLFVCEFRLWPLNIKDRFGILLVLICKILLCFTAIRQISNITTLLVDGGLLLVLFSV